jgi:hypothetical protein
MPTVQLGPMSWVATSETQIKSRASLPTNALLTDLVLGVIRLDPDIPEYRWLKCGCRTLVCQPLELGEEKFLGLYCCT